MRALPRVLVNDANPLVVAPISAYEYLYVLKKGNIRMQALPRVLYVYNNNMYILQKKIF
jgi:hypothetical protein